LLDFFTAGLVLCGTEIKSIRLGKASLADSYCIIQHGELWAKNIQVAEYFFGSYNNHQPKRDRKLLLTKRELAKITRLTKETGFTIVPIKLYLNEKGTGQAGYRRGQGLKRPMITGGP
jgi:SsrA-binding protein